jgi:hypothetical protein
MFCSLERSGGDECSMFWRTISTHIPMQDKRDISSTVVTILREIMKICRLLKYFEIYISAKKLILSRHLFLTHSGSKQS